MNSKEEIMKKKGCETDQTLIHIINASFFLLKLHNKTLIVNKMNQ